MGRSWFLSLWTTCLFLMFAIIGIDFVAVLVTVIRDLISDVFAPFKFPERVCLIFLLLFIGGFACFLTEGAYVVQMLDSYIGGVAILGIVMFEAIAFATGYGVIKASEDIERMQHYKPSLWIQFCWMFAVPISLMVLFLYSLNTMRLTSLFNRPFPEWANKIGLFLVILSLIQIPIIMLVTVVQNIKSWKSILKADPLWQPVVHNGGQCC